MKDCYRTLTQHQAGSKMWLWHVSKLKREYISGISSSALNLITSQINFSDDSCTSRPVFVACFTFFRFEILLCAYSSQPLKYYFIFYFSPSFSNVWNTRRFQFSKRPTVAICCECVLDTVNHTFRIQFRRSRVLQQWSTITGNEIEFPLYHNTLQVLQFHNHQMALTFQRLFRKWSFSLLHSCKASLFSDHSILLFFVPAISKTSDLFLYGLGLHFCHVPSS